MKNKLVKRLKTKVSGLKARLGSLKERVSKPALASLLALAVVLIAGASLARPELVSKPKSYDLVILALTSMGFMPVGHLLITNVSHEADGSLCFINVQTEKHMCLKFDTYDMTEAEVK